MLLSNTFKCCISAIVSAIALYYAFDVYRVGWFFAILSFVILFNAIGKTKGIFQRMSCVLLYLIVFVTLQYSFLLHVSIRHEQLAFLMLFIVVAVYLAPMLFWIIFPLSYPVESFACIFLISEYVFAKSAIGNQMFQLGIAFVDFGLLKWGYAFVGPWVLSAVGILLSYLLYKLLFSSCFSVFVAVVFILCIASHVELYSERANESRSICVSVCCLDNVSEIESVLFETDCSADYVVLPEAMLSVPEDALAINPFMTQLYRRSRLYGTTYVSGFYTYSNGKTNNAAVVSNYEIEFLRSKKILVPFAEYIPCEKLIKKSDFIMSHLPSPLMRGVGSDCFNDGVACFAPLICFEALFSNYIAHLCRVGAEVFFVSSSNLLIDSEHIEKISHKIMQMNSLVTRRSFARSSEHGISCIVSDGGAVEVKPSCSKAMITCNVILNDELTLYSSYDIIIDSLYYILNLLMLFLVSLKSKQRALVIN